MMVLITYDVETIDKAGQKRLRQVAKQCVNYGQRVQNSVFECILTPAQFTSLKIKLTEIIDDNKDSLRFYYLGKNWVNNVESVGKVTSFDMERDLIV